MPAWSPSDAPKEVKATAVEALVLQAYRPKTAIGAVRLPIAWVESL